MEREEHRRKKNCLYCLLLLALLLLVTACDLGESPEDYYVSFEADGVPVTLSAGEFGDSPTYDHPYLVFDSPKSRADIYASEAGNSNHVIHLRTNSLNPGTYDFLDCSLMYSTDYQPMSPTFGPDESAVEPLSITINQSGAVGEAVTGTFYGTLKKSDDSTQMVVTGGEFRVLRIE